MHAINTKKALRWMDRGITKNRRFPDILVGLSEEGSPRLAFELTKQHLADGGELSSTHLINLGVSLRAARLVREAITIYDDALNVEDAADIHYAKGNALRQLGRLGLSLRSYQRALDLDPSFLDAMNNMALSYRDLRRYRPAKQLLLKILDKEEDVCARRNLGSVYWLSGEPFPTVMTEYAKCLSLNPLDADVLLVISSMLHDMGHFEASSKFASTSLYVKVEEPSETDAIVKEAVRIAFEFAEDGPADIGDPGD